MASGHGRLSRGTPQTRSSDADVAQIGGNLKLRGAVRGDRADIGEHGGDHRGCDEAVGDHLERGSTPSAQYPSGRVYIRLDWASVASHGNNACSDAVVKPANGADPNGGRGDDARLHSRTTFESRHAMWRGPPPRQIVANSFIVVAVKLERVRPT